MLYSARTRLMSLVETPVFHHAMFRATPVCQFFLSSPIFFEEGATVSHSHSIFSSNAIPAAPVKHDDRMVGVLRRESVQRIFEADRQEAFQLPISSLVTRSFTVIHTNTTWTEMLRSMKNEKSLAVIACNSDGQICFGLTVDTVLDTVSRFLQETQDSFDEDEETGEINFDETNKYL